MPSDRKQPGLSPDIVNSIFQPKVKKELSSLFVPNSTRKLVKEAPPDKAITIKSLPIGVDIGTNSIKIIQLDYNYKTSQVKIEKTILEEIPLEAQENDLIRPKVILDILKKMIGENNLKGECFSAMPGISTKISLVNLPQMPAGEIGKAVQWEIRQSSQADTSELSMDYVLLEKQKNIFPSNQMAALVVSVLKKDALRYLALLESVGLKAMALDGEPLADLAALEYAKLVPLDKMVLVLDFGAGKSILSFISCGELMFIRPLATTGNSLTKAISQYCKMTLPEAEIAKINFQQNKDAQVKNAIAPLLENMVQDIEHAFKYFSFQVARSQITRFDKVILSGGSSSLNSFESFLSNRLNVEVACVGNARFNIALGLALRGI